MDKEQEYKVFDKERQANEPLIEKLKSFRKYINDEMPEWVQLIAIGGFVADVIKLLKWDDFERVYNPWNSPDTSRMSMMRRTEIIEELWTAIDYHLNAPYAEELNAIWQNWDTDETYKPETETVTDLYDVIISKIEENYPGFADEAERYFNLSSLE